MWCKSMIPFELLRYQQGFLCLVIRCDITIHMWCSSSAPLVLSLRTLIKMNSFTLKQCYYHLLFTIKIITKKSRIRKLLCKFAVESWLLCRYDYFYFFLWLLLPLSSLQAQKVLVCDGATHFPIRDVLVSVDGKNVGLTTWQESLTYLIHSNSHL